MSLIQENSLLSTWLDEYNETFKKSLIVLLVVFPFIVFILIELLASIKFEKTFESVEKEIVQAVINGDSYMGKRILNVLVDTLELEYAEIKVNKIKFASSGEENTLLDFAKLKINKKVESPWSDSLGFVFLKKKILSQQRIIFFIVLVVNSIAIIIIKKLTLSYKKKIIPIIREIENLTNELSESSLADYSSIELKGTTLTTRTATNLYDSMIRFIRKNEKLKIEILALEKNKEIFEVTKQVAHDIRSPLSVLSILRESVRLVSEEKHRLLTAAINKIQIIAEDLLEKSRNIENDMISKENLFCSNILEDIDEILNTAKITDVTRISFNFENKSTLKVVVLKQRKGIFFRVFQNLLNNAVESFLDSENIEKKALIQVIIEENPQEVVISIEDNGKGIPELVINEIGKRSFSYGKYEGNGLGLFSAINFMNEINGKLEISSKVMEGTTIKLRFKKSELELYYK